MYIIDKSLCKQTITVDRKVVFSLIHTSDLFDPDNKSLLLNNPNPAGLKSLIFVDSFVDHLFHSKIENYFEKNKVEARIVPIECGEDNKNLSTMVYVLSEINAFQPDRKRHPILILGGGVLIDVVAFAASCYRRGIPYIKIPTTLMGYVDVSVAIKTGINFMNQKNRIGSFSPPLATILDRAFLKSLPPRHLANGIAEIIKLAVIKDSNLFSLLENDAEAAMKDHFQTTGESILNLSISSMLEELEPNFYEDNLERKVDFGHTFSPALELKKIGSLLHGEAVAIDICLSSIIAKNRGLLIESEIDRILWLVKKCDLPVFDPAVSINLMWESVQERTHHRDGFQRIPLPCGIGNAIFIHDLSYKELDRAIHTLKEEYAKIDLETVKNPSN